ncbi:MAG TPA: EF-hand domain-containing protein [Devosiaceae bacterium]
MNRALVILATLGVLACGTAAFADEVDFAQVDANGDGAISYDELAAALPDVTQDQFNAADADQNGSLSTDEYAALVADLAASN